MSRKTFAIVAGVGCLGLIVLIAVVAVGLIFFPLQARRVVSASPTETAAPGALATQQAVATITSEPSGGALQTGSPTDIFRSIHEQLAPGVVSIRVLVQQQGQTGQGAGSGFVLDREGHIVTNDHVVAQAEQIRVVFYNSVEAEAQVVGMDDDSDLAVIQVDNLPEGVVPLVLGDSDAVQVGDWAIAIGNPFGVGTSLTVGVVSAIGRAIPSLQEAFLIPQAIQTDAAINPGNSGGPLISAGGEVIGVNAQIASGSGRASAGVGFAIPSNVVRRVVPVLIEQGLFEWPWLGVEGTSVNLEIQRANDLLTQQGAYISRVVPGGPADQAGLQGSTGTTDVDGLAVPVGGDVVVEADGVQIVDFVDLLYQVSQHDPGETIDLVVLRAGERTEVTVELEARRT